MKESLLDVLREPVTGAVLKLEVDKWDGQEVVAGRLISQETGREYPIRDGIPRMVDEDNYCASFGLQWNLMSQVQVDSATGAWYSHHRFDVETDWGPDELEGRWILDAGCGCGRFAEVAAEYGGQVIAMDYSSAVDAARQNLSRFGNVHFVQGDILNPPLATGSLDFVYSIGVLQHTPDPRVGMTSLIRRLKPGGEFTFTIYSRKWYTKLYSKYWLRPVTRRLPPRFLLGAVRASMPVLFPMSDVAFRLPLLGKVARFVLPVANYVEKTEFTRQQRYHEAVLDTFDMLSPAFDEPMSPNEVTDVLRQEEVERFFFRTEFPVVVCGQTSLSNERLVNETQPVSVQSSGL